MHGEDEANKAQAAARALFAGGGDDSTMPTTELDVPEDGINVVDLMVACKLASSKGEARRLIQQGGLTLDGEKVTDTYQLVTKAQLLDGVKLRKGKKVFHRAIAKA